MSNPFIQPGTLIHRLVVYLLQHPGAEFATAALCEALDITSDTLYTGANRAIRSNIIAVRKAGNLAFWSLSPSFDRADPFGAESNAQDDPPEDKRSIFKVSADATPSVFAYAEQRGAAPFSLGFHTDGRVSFQRAGREVLELTAAEAVYVTAEFVGRA